MKVYVLIWEDRHTDDEIELYTDLDVAVARAEAIIEEYRSDNYDYTDLDAEHPLTVEMVKEGWHFYKLYSVEGDHVRIEEKELEV